MYEADQIAAAYPMIHHPVGACRFCDALRWQIAGCLIRLIQRGEL